MKSIRQELTRSLLVALVVLLLVGGFATYFGVRAFLVSQFDAALVGKGRALTALVELEDGRIQLELTDEMLPAFERSEDPDCFQLWIEGGEALERSHSLRGRNLPHRALVGPSEEIFDLDLPDGRRARAVAIRFRPHVSDGNLHLSDFIHIHRKQKWNQPSQHQNTQSERLERQRNGAKHVRPRNRH